MFQGISHAPLPSASFQQGQDPGQEEWVQGREAQLYYWMSPCGPELPTALLQTSVFPLCKMESLLIIFGEFLNSRG